jgi:predicted Fe-Mo cluster-binding NifX family protein
LVSAKQGKKLGKNERGEINYAFLLSCQKEFIIIQKILRHKKRKLQVMMRKTMIKIAFPTESDLGLKDTLSQHFGHTRSFTIVSWDSDTKIAKNVEVFQNQGHEEGGCMNPVMALKNNGVNVIVLGGIGMRPLMGFRQVGITPVEGIEGTVELNLKAYTQNKLREMKEAPCHHHDAF